MSAADAARRTSAAIEPGSYVADQRAGTDLTGARGKHEGVAVDDVVRPEYRSDWPDFIPGRDDRGDRPPGDLQRGMPRRGGSGLVGRAQVMACQDEQLAGLEVLALGAYAQSAGAGPVIRALRRR
jgi:hypothetical protein